MSVELTLRDFQVLHLLREQGFATTEQLMTLGFPSRGALKKRLCLLRADGYISSQSAETNTTLRKVLSRLEGKTLGKISGLIHRRRLYQLGSALNPEAGRHKEVNTRELVAHQLDLTSVRRFFLTNYPESVLETECETGMHLSHLGASRSAQAFPDLTLHLQGRRIAIEMERNIKEESRYFVKWQTYMRSTYSHVLYYCETDAIFESLAKRASQFPKIAFGDFLSPQKIYTVRRGFERLEDFLNRVPQ